MTAAAVVEEIIEGDQARVGEVAHVPGRGDEWTDERPLEEIARELGGLAASLAAMTCRFLVLLAEFDRRRGWERQGIASASHWLSWRCGLSTTTAREHVRVARRLPDLPHTVEQFAAGRLSYSKVRAITRVATAETEEELLAMAASATANQLDRFVAGVATAASVEEINARHSQRYLSFRTEDDGSVSFSGRCSPEDGAAILERLRLIQDYLERTGSTDLDGEHTTDSEPLRGERALVTQGRSLLDALVLLCEEATVGSATDPLVADDAIGSRRSETVLHVTLDELTDAAARGVGVAADPVIGAPPGVPTSSHAAEGTPSTNAPAGAPPASAVRIGPRLEMGPALHPATARRLSCDTGLVVSHHAAAPTSPARTGIPHSRLGGALNLGRRRRLASRAQLRALWDRDHGCRFPGCERRRYLHAHHIRHWADGGRTDLDNLVLLCGQHHRLLHEGEYTLTLHGDVVTIHDDAGRALPTVPAPEATDQVQRPRLAIVPRPDAPPDALPLDPVDGGPLDLEYAVGVVAERWQLRRAQPRRAQPRRAQPR